MVLRILELAEISFFAAMLLVIAGIHLLIYGAWLSIIDLRSMLLPNRLLYPMTGVGTVLLVSVAVVTEDYTTARSTFLGAMLNIAGFSMLYLIAQGTLGFGDVKFSVPLGAYSGFLSLWHVLYAAVMGFMLAAGTALYKVLRHDAQRDSTFPLGPALFMGTVAALMLPAT